MARIVKIRAALILAQKEAFVLKTKPACVMKDIVATTAQSSTVKLLKRAPASMTATEEAPADFGMFVLFYFLQKRNLICFML